MPCRYLWKSDFGDWVCGQSGRFVVLGVREEEAPDPCERCELRSSGNHTALERWSFHTWQAHISGEIARAEWQAEKSAELTVALDELNELQRIGDEDEAALLRERMLAEYRDIGLVDVYQEDDFWTVRMHPSARVQIIEDPVL